MTRMAAKSIEVGMLMFCALVLLNACIYFAGVVLGVERLEADKSLVVAVMGIGAIYFGVTPFKSLFFSEINQKSEARPEEARPEESAPHVVTETRLAWRPVIIINGLLGSIAFAVGHFSQSSVGGQRITLAAIVFFLAFLAYSVAGYKALRDKAPRRQLSVSEIRGLVSVCFGGKLFFAWMFTTIVLILVILTV